MTTRINIFPVLAAVLLLLGFSQAWADSASLSAPQEDRIREIVADTLRQKPELVLEALKTLEERQKAAEEAKIQEQLSVNEKVCSSIRTTRLGEPKRRRHACRILRLPLSILQKGAPGCYGAPQGRWKYPVCLQRIPHPGSAVRHGGANGACFAGVGKISTV